MVLLQIRTQNMENYEKIYDLLEILNSDSFDEEYIKNLIPTKDSEEFKHSVLENLDGNASKELTIKRLKKQ